MPYSGEHSCRLLAPRSGAPTRRVNGEREHEGKKYDVIYQQQEDKSWPEQAFRYPKQTWSAGEARAHCKAHKGILFEPAADEEKAGASQTMEKSCCGPNEPRGEIVMLRYEHVLNYVANSAWAILPSKMNEILSVLAHRATGQSFSAEEIRAQIGERVSPEQTKRGAIAVIPLRGTIAHRIGSMTEASGGVAAERFAAAMKILAADESLETIVIDCDSPGGTVTGVPEAAEAVFEARGSKRIIAVANATMASAAYWICSQAHEVIGIPSIYEGLIGSIGCFTVHKDLTAALEKEGIKLTFISAGLHKLPLSPFGPLTDDEHAELQAMVDAGYDRFVKDVARGRGVTPAIVRHGFGEGRGLSAVDARAAGLIDRIATMEATLHRLAGGRRSVSGGRAAAQAALPLVAQEAPPKIDPEDVSLSQAIIEPVAAETFGCSCTISCPCQDGQTEWCPTGCETCKGDCACQQHNAAKAAADPKSRAVLDAQQAAANDAIAIAIALGD